MISSRHKTWCQKITIDSHISLFDFQFIMLKTLEPLLNYRELPQDLKNY